MSDVGRIIQQARQELLDLSARNRLLDTPRQRARSHTVELTGERSDAVFRRLVEDGRGLGFRPHPEPEPEPDDEELGEDPFAGLAPPPGAADGETGRAHHQELWQDPRHEQWLQTELGAERLQSRLLRLHYDARSHDEERGVGVLYLALGFLEWYETPLAQQPRHAPLILVPARLERGSADERFRLWFADEEIATNLSLAERLRRDFALALPEIDPAERLEPAAYFRLVAEAVRPQPRFRVHADQIVFGLFSFARLLMYRDLDPATWPAEMALDQRPLLRALLSDGFRAAPEKPFDDQRLDELLPPRAALHVLDADASQVSALEAVRAGHNLLIEGPPGTGKSQTAANLIAAAVHAGQTVLFVAEKMAALEVVKRRLDQIGLGELCQELHSRRASRRSLLDELERTLQLGAPRQENPTDRFEELAALRARLNHHARSLHRPVGRAGVPPFEAIGRLAELQARGAASWPVKLPGASHWSPAELRERRDQLQALVGRVAELGIPALSPWRGVGLQALLPSERDAIGQAVNALHEQMAMLLKAARKLEEWLGARPATPSLEQLARLIESAASLARLPAETDAAALQGEIWQQSGPAIRDLVAAGASLAGARHELRPVVTEAAWSLDLTATRRDLAAHGGPWWRWCNAAWRRARATLRALAKGAPPTRLGDQLALLGRLIAAQAARQQVLQGDALGRAAFGSLWAGEGSDWDKLGAVLAWRRELPEPALLPCLARLLAEVGEREPPIRLAAHSRRLLAAVDAGWSALAQQLQLDPGEAFGEPKLESLALSRVLERLASWAAQPAGLELWVAYGAQRRLAVGLGMCGLAYQLHHGGLPAARALDAFDQAYYDLLLRQALAADPVLAAFSGPEQELRIERFQELDRARIRTARREVAAAHHARLPQHGSEIGQLGLLEREFAKKRRHLPIRQLLARAAQPIQAIKPVFMMSPSSVAEFLAPGALRFNLLVMDEASQIEPVDAFGALARAAQIVVLGDRRQLPPSRLLEAGGSEDERPVPEADGEAPPHGDLESILEACAAAGIAQRRLSWHYRSRHPSLIAVSNRELYEDRLHVAPSPFAKHPELGLVLRHVADGRFERGAGGLNRREAELIAEAVIAHARISPELSLGVGCFSLRQRDAILAQLEHLWRAEPPEVREFFAGTRPEPFFVKSLETIQGDERDVVLISVGYGRDPSGQLATSFGPLDHEGGERRLNVLISRARARLEVFASITADDIDLGRAGGRGVALLESFLRYAATRVLGSAEVGGRGFASPFEADLARALAGLGHQVDGQVGPGGFVVDLAVRDPERQGRYLLGIACDGASYHGAVWARDRDRLRQQALEDRGWILHRVWSSEWLRDPAGELRRITAALEEARARWAARDESLEVATGLAGETDEGLEAPIPRAPAAAEEAVETGLRAQPYREADFSLPDQVEPHRLSAAAMAETVARIVEIEGPVHGDEIARRVTRLAGLERTGRRIAEAVNHGLARAVREGRIARAGRFYALPGAPTPIRDRSAVLAAGLRRPEMLPPAELQAAVLEVASAHYGAAAGEIATRVGRLLGFAATSARLRALIEAETLRLLASGRLDRQGPSLVPAQPDSRPAA